MVLLPIGIRTSGLKYPIRAHTKLDQGNKAKVRPHHSYLQEEGQEAHANCLLVENTYVSAAFR